MGKWVRGINFFQSVRLGFIVVCILLVLMTVRVVKICFIERLRSALRRGFGSTVRREIGLLDCCIRRRVAGMELPSRRTASQRRSVEELLDSCGSTSVSRIHIISRSLAVLNASSPSGRKIIKKESASGLVGVTVTAGRPMARSLISRKREV